LDAGVIMSRYQKYTRIGDIAVIFITNECKVEVHDCTQDKTLEVLEYSDFNSANEEYNMLCSLLKKIAAIHPLVKT
jgi:hypothetical protein